MRFFNILFLLLLLTGCNNTKKVFWCGDHPCVNDREKKEYFKKTGIVEVKDYKKDDVNNSEIIKLQEKALADEKKRIEKSKNLKKQAKLDEKRKIKEEKRLAKQAKLDEKRKIKEEKRRVKEEKRLAKQANKKKKKLSKKVKSKKKENNKIEISNDIAKLEIETKTLDKLIEKINKKNMFRPYPDINDIPN
tara:strand:- start:63 stop:635 length:573 start_codon:yes stop_codon:yes gene_type:complete